MDRPTGYTATCTKDRSLWGTDAEKYGWINGTTKYRAVITNRKTGKTLSFTYFTGPAHTERPAFKELMGAVISDASCYESNPTLDEFLLEYGYDDAMEKDGEKAFKACASMHNRSRALLGDDYEAMAEYVAQ